MPNTTCVQHGHDMLRWASNQSHRSSVVGQCSAGLCGACVRQKRAVGGDLFVLFFHDQLLLLPSSTIIR